jgi:hypothetical protein
MVYDTFFDRSFEVLPQKGMVMTASAISSDSGDSSGLVPKLSLADAQAAARLIEIDGSEAYQTVSRKYGKDVAFLLLVSHIRHNLGSTQSFPPDSAIDGKVEEILRESNIPYK